MRSIFYSCLIIFLFNISLVSQDITTTLSGNTSAQGFTVLNAQGDTLFRITGEGYVGIGTSQPLGPLDIRSSAPIFPDGYPLYIRGQSGVDNGGDINLISGDAANASGGDILIQALNGNQSGNISLLTSTSNDGGGEILLQTGNANSGGNGIKLITGNDASITGQNSIVLQAGNYGGIKLSAGSDPFSGSDPGGNIELTPGTGAPNGTVIINGSGTYTGSWTQASDERFKTNIRPITNATDKVLKMNGVSYYLRSEEFPEKNFDNDLHLGLIAQNVEKVIPEVVKTDIDGYKSIAYQNLVPVLIEAIKEQQASIEPRFCNRN